MGSKMNKTNHRNEHRHVFKTRRKRKNKATAKRVEEPTTQVSRMDPGTNQQRGVVRNETQVEATAQVVRSTEQVREESTPQEGREESTAQEGREGSTPHERREGSTPQERREESTAQEGREGSTPQERRKESMAQERREGNMVQERREESTAQEGSDGSTVQERREGSTVQERGVNETEKGTPIQGSRIINIDKLKKYNEDLAAHASKCQGTVVLSGETRNGLASIIQGRCDSCQHTIILETSPKVKGPKGYNRWECNLAAVWGEMSTGGGHSHLEETMGVLGVPVMTKASFITSERQIGEWWKEKLVESMAAAGREEKLLAEERGEYHEGVPAITVIVDGGWSKRSHRHSYNANSGVAIILGKETGKLLHIGVRNKFCTACALNIPKENHSCYRNWSESSSEMETDIIVEGFVAAERVHGLRYTRFIGDGDSSVYPTLIQRVHGWGHVIKKLECANHCCKCYRGALEKLVQENSSYKGKGGLTLTMRTKLVSAARSAIRMRSKESDRTAAVKSLKRDLANGPNHCFGNHANCSQDFCTAAKDRSEAPSGSIITGTGGESDVEEDNDEVVEVLLDQERLWRDTLTDDPTTEREILRGGTVPTTFSRELYQVILSRLVAKASQLIDNATTNLAECWMHIRSKFDGGKVINRSQSGSWEHRCMGAGLQQNMGKEWGPQLWKHLTHSSPNKVFLDTAERSAKKAKKEKLRKAREDVKRNRRRRKYTRNSESTAARKAYSRHDSGLSPNDVDDDISAEHLEKLKSGFYDTKVVITRAQAEQIERQTCDQADSDQWISERRKRITASRVGGIAKMRKTTKKAKKVENMLYSNFRGNTATIYGSAMEDKARYSYETHQRQNGHSNLEVKRCGLFVSTDNPWLAATPDGLVDDPSDSTSQSLGLVEIKNPYTARNKTLTEAVHSSSFCLQHKDSTLELKTRHDYHFQIQTQLYCTGRHWCDFVVKTNKDLHIQRIYKDQSWLDTNLPKLKQFYFAALLPELACPRFQTGGIREPTTPSTS